MPLYEYCCRDCGHRFEILQKMGEGAEAVECPRCGAGRPERALSTFAAVVAAPSVSAGCCADAPGCCADGPGCDAGCCVN